MRPTFSRFDIHDLLDTLPPFVRHPMAVATMASVLAHGVIAVGLPVFAGSDEKKPERVVDVISLSPAEQSKLPSNGLMMPGGGLNGTSALPLPLSKNGALSPLSGLSSSTIGSNGSSYSGVPGLLDPPIISYTQPSSTTRANSDSGSRKTTSTFSFTDNAGKTKVNDLLMQLAQQSQTQQPSDPTAGKDKTALPPGEKPPASSEIAALPPGATGGTPAKTPETPTPAGTLNDGNTPPSPTATPSSTATPALLTAAQTYGDPESSIGNNRNEATALFGTAYTKLTKALTEVNPAGEIDPTTLNFKDMPVLSLKLELLKTSDKAVQEPGPVEFLVLMAPDGTLLTRTGTDGKVVLENGLLRKAGYSKITAQAETSLQQIASLQEEVKKQLQARIGITSKSKQYSLLKLIFQPTSATATG